MAANPNYFGFAHGGTQYAATGNPAYQAPQATGYAVAQTAAAAAAATYTSQRAATGYDTYQQAAQPGTYAVAAGTTPAAPYDYGYAARTAPAAAYDTTKSYYQQSAPATQQYASGDYQAGKSAYSATYTTQSVRPAAQQHKPAQYPAAYTPAQAAPTQTANYTYPAPVQSQVPKGGAPAYNGATAVTYGNTVASTNFNTAYTAQNPSTVQTTATPKPRTGKPATAWTGYKKPGTGPNNKPMRAKPPQPKPQQLHYCEVCKISCAGPQTYREHLEGQRHKKKELLQKEGAAPPTSARGAHNLRCELCDVVCTGSDAYAAHLRGSKHMKVVKLHKILGKPIPEVELKTAKAPAAPAGAAVSVTSPPKINFVQSGNLGTVGKTAADAKETIKEEVADVEMAPENEVTPVGQEYIEELRSDDGKLLSFNCKLCECKFNDPNAKDMHMKGRRHRLQFKKKVNPDLVVDVKPSGRRGRIQEEKMRRRDDFLRRREDDRSFWTDDRLYWEERRRYEEEFEFAEWMRRRGPVPPSPFLQPHPFGLRRLDTPDDRHIILKHQQIFPKDPKLQTVLKVVNHCEKAVKVLIDQTQPDPKEKDAKAQTVVKKEPGTVAAIKKEVESPVKIEPGKPGSTADKPGWIITGIVRVGILAKNLMLTDENNVELVALCNEIPTKQSLAQAYNSFASQLKIVAPEENYNVTLDMGEACITVATPADPPIVVNITLTSRILRDMLLQGDGATVAMAVNQETLDQAKCLEALAQLRRAKWFQARPANNHSSVIVIRIIRDLCHRNPTWAPLSQWALELLVDKVVGCVGFSVAEALRKVLEAIAGGVLLPGSAGIFDPCEREPTDASANMTIQERTDITASAQHALRLMAFRQIHKVLGMAPIPPPRGALNRHNNQRFNRKRRRDNSTGENNDSEAGDGKKDKKEGEAMETAPK
ncbi:DZF [Nesidiocoris tenuis]|uniref:DZF n=1 Tax=Nesidiocoris tenuis TaxID=355587 RepID=A0ABN7AR75_9HEMI|nr:DZF [Nesidiocoris tenuis]